MARIELVEAGTRVVEERIAMRESLDLGLFLPIVPSLRGHKRTHRAEHGGGGSNRVKAAAKGRQSERWSS
jgi:hypothetical protein